MQKAQQKPFRKREGLSLKKFKAFDLTRKIQLSIKKDEEEAQKISIKHINSIRSIGSAKRLANKSKTSRNTKHESNPYIDDLEQKPKHFQHNKKPSKFTKLPLNSPLSKYDENIHRLVQQLTPKSKGFYRFGMKSHEKPSHKRVYSEVMNIPKENIEGVMFVGELWSNSMSNKFMNLNKVNMNKTKFFEKLRDMKWDKIKKEREKQLDSSNLITSVREFSQKSQKSIKSFQYFQSLLSLKHLHSQIHHQPPVSDVILQHPSQSSLAESRKRQRSLQYQKNSKSFKESLSLIRNSIDDECKRCKDEEYWKNMKGLESEGREMHRLWDRYFGKMLQMG